MGQVLKGFVHGAPGASGITPTPPNQMNMLGNAQKMEYPSNQQFRPMPSPPPPPPQ